MHEGLRWQDIKRYGIPVYRRLNDGYRYVVQSTLSARDPRQALQLPSQAIKGKIVQNPTK
jgi:susD homolog